MKRIFCGYPGLLALLALSPLWVEVGAQAGMNEMMDAFHQSEFSFARTTSEVPFYPLGWAQNKFYPSSEFKEQNGDLPSGRVVENTLNAGGLAPVFIARRDLGMVGLDAAWDTINVQSGPYQDQSIVRLTPVAAWLHQFGTQETVGAFAAPIFSQEMKGDQPWGVNGYAGIVAIHYFNEEYQLIYGGVYQYDFGQHVVYPYLGLNWLLSPKCNIAIVFPWPTISYVPADRWLLQLALAPGGSSWVQHDNGYQNTESFGSWNLSANVAYRLHGKFWLMAGAGVASLRGLTIESGGDSTTRFDSKPGAVFTLAIQFRP